MWFQSSSFVLNIIQEFNPEAYGVAGEYEVFTKYCKFDINVSKKMSIK